MHQRSSYASGTGQSRHARRERHCRRNHRDCAAWDRARSRTPSTHFHPAPMEPQSLAALLLLALLVELIEVVNLDCQFAPHEVEQHRTYFYSCLKRGAAQGRVTIAPHV